jgi:spermidine synthase
VLSVSTAGSIVGTFATTYVALPTLGLTRTFLGAAIVLALLGILVLAIGAKSLGLAGVLLATAVVGALGMSHVRPPMVTRGWVLEDATESAYQSLRVVVGEEAGHEMRRLQVNEGFDSFQSVWQPNTGFLPDGYYYNLFALPAIWERREGDWRLCVLGLGAGTTWRVMEGTLPKGTRLVASGVEIDPAVVALGSRWFDLRADEESRRVFSGWDARAALRWCARDCDQIVLDAYANQMEIPAHLCTREFFLDVRSRLAPGGWLCVNVGGFGLGDPVVEAVAATASDAFGRRLLALRVPFSRNCVLFVRRDASPPAPEGADWHTGTEDFDQRLSALSVPGAWRWFSPGSLPILTDDHNPIDALQRESVEQGKKLWFTSP